MLVSVLSGIAVAVPPVALWLFDDGGAMDSSGNGNDGELKGPVPGEGKFESGLEFDGQDDVIEVPDAPSLDISGDLSIVAWIFARDVASYRTFLTKGDAQTEKVNYGVQIEGGGSHLRFFASDGTQYHFVDSESTVSPNEWIHVAIILNTTEDKVMFYFNGTLDATRDFAFDLLPSEISLWLGQHIHITLGASQFWDGFMDEVAIYNVVLTEDDIQKVMSGLASITAVSLKGKLAVTWGAMKHGR